MKRVLIFNILFIVFFLAPVTVKAQETVDEHNNSVTNEEPSHAYYALGEESTLPIKLVPVGDEGMMYLHSFKFRSTWTGKQIFVRICGINVSFHLKITVVQGLPIDHCLKKQGSNRFFWNGQGIPGKDRALNGTHPEPAVVIGKQTSVCHDLGRQSAFFFHHEQFSIP